VWCEAVVVVGLVNELELFGSEVLPQLRAG
jgi:hypothetical protein